MEYVYDHSDTFLSSFFVYSVWQRHGHTTIENRRKLFEYLKIDVTFEVRCFYALRKFNVLTIVTEYKQIKRA